MGREWVTYLRTLRGEIVLMGGPGSGHWRHAGRKGKKGGSAPSKGGAPAIRGSEDIRDEALTFVKELTTYSVPPDLEPLSDEAKEFLGKTVTEDSYKLYRGMGIVKHKVKGIYTREQVEELNALKPGDKAPDFLAKQHVSYSSYTKKVSVAKYYSEGRISMVLEANVPAKSVIVDLEKLPDVLKAAGWDPGKLVNVDYFKGGDKEVLVQEPVDATIRNITGRMPL